MISNLRAIAFSFFCILAAYATAEESFAGEVRADSVWCDVSDYDRADPKSISDETQKNTRTSFKWASDVEPHQSIAKSWHYVSNFHPRNLALRWKKTGVEITTYNPLPNGRSFCGGEYSNSIMDFEVDSDAPIEVYSDSPKNAVAYVVASRRSDFDGGENSRKIVAGAELDSVYVDEEGQEQLASGSVILFYQPATGLLEIEIISRSSTGLLTINPHSLGFKTNSAELALKSEGVRRVRSGILEDILDEPVDPDGILHSFAQSEVIQFGLDGSAKLRFKNVWSMPSADSFLAIHTKNGSLVGVKRIPMKRFDGLNDHQIGISERPNILALWGDDIGQSNISAYTKGLMGYRTPNIDRIANEGMLFTDYYGEQSCTAGRSSFITGQSVFRTGLSKVSLPGAKKGMMIEDPTIAGLLKARGYATGQFGMNHLGGRDEHLPTNHGFDEFFGNLHHLNAEDELENEDYPGDMVLPNGTTFRETFGPRGVIKSFSDGTIVDTGPLTRKRMETVDDETVAAAIDFIERSESAGTPWFVWWSGTRMHFPTHVKPEMRENANELAGKKLDEYQAGMIEHDLHIGQFLEKLDELGITDNTIVLYSTDNGPRLNTWPDAGTSPFFGQKNTNFEGGWRVPSMARWPNHIPEGSVSNEIMHHMDWLPTLLAAAGNDTIKEDLKAGGVQAIGREYKVHLDGYNFLPHLTGAEEEGPRKEIFYFSDDGDLTALRWNEWKMIFMEQKEYKTFRAWMEPFTPLRVPLIINLRRDPYERSYQTSNTYYDWLLDRAYLLVPAQAYVGNFLATFQEFPPRQKAASFSLDQVMERMPESN